MMVFGTLGGGIVALEDQLVEDAVLGGPAFAAYRLNTTGKADINTNTAGLLDIPGQWWTAAPQAGIGSGYEVRATYVSGVVPSGAAQGVWLPLSTLRVWSISKDDPGSRIAVFTVEIRAVGGGVLDSATVTLQAIWEV